MKQKKLFKTIEKIASQRYSSEEDLLFGVLKQIVADDQIKVTGGRIWKLFPENHGYKLLYQTGNVHKINRNFMLYMNEYPIFDVVTSERTVLADETNKTLISKGIFKYSASGIGSKIKTNGKRYYQYLLAVNSAEIDEELRYILNIIATVLTSKINEIRASKTRKHLIADIDKAKQLQRSILPDHEIIFHRYEIFGATIPAEIVSGDYFDYLTIGDGEERMGIVVGDAASKGFGAAASAMYISGAVRMASNFQIKISPMMFRLNQLINKIFADDQFTSMFYGEISNDKKGLFLYANAGHNPPIFFKCKTNQTIYLESTGPLLGPAPNSRYETDSINFDKGDVLVIYSDGIVEAANDKFEFYEEKRLDDLIRKNNDKSPKEIAHAILDDVYHFSTSESQYQDDKTIVVIKRN